MPSKSPAQARLMAAAAHTDGGYGGVPQNVGKKFNQADAGTGILSKRSRHMAQRKEHGLSHAAVGKEFGVSKSTAHRHVTKANALRDGFTRLGRADR